jgi:hypothetical protein
LRVETVGESAPGGTGKPGLPPTRFDKAGHLAEISAMLTISFARFKICKGSLQTG